jgi:hypothetical protein
LGRSEWLLPLNNTVAGEVETTLKNENGARLNDPFLRFVPIQPIGLGTINPDRSL